MLQLLGDALKFRECPCVGHSFDIRPPSWYVRDGARSVWCDGFVAWRDERYAVRCTIIPSATRCPMLQLSFVQIVKINGTQNWSLAMGGSFIKPAFVPGWKDHERKHLNSFCYSVSFCKVLWEKLYINNEYVFIDEKLNIALLLRLIVVNRIFFKFNCFKNPRVGFHNTKQQTRLRS